jgi:ABC-type uncharacterized transport system permease subunit
MNTAQRVVVVLTMVVIGAAVAFAFLPLPNQTFQGEPATCGPGSSSSSAIVVKLSPRSVISGSPGYSQLTSAQRAVVDRFVNQCQGVADTRLWIVVVVGVAALLIGLACFYVVDPRNTPPSI